MADGVKAGCGFTAASLSGALHQTGNSYSQHGIAETVAEMPDKPGRSGFIGANGGIMSKYSVGIYSTEPVDWRTSRSEALKADISALPTVAVTKTPDGAGTIETYSVRYDWPARTGIIVGRLDAGGPCGLTASRFALTAVAVHAPWTRNGCAFPRLHARRGGAWREDRRIAGRSVG